MFTSGGMGGRALHVEYSTFHQVQVPNKYRENVRYIGDGASLREKKTRFGISVKSRSRIVRTQLCLRHKMFLPHLHKAIEFKNRTLSHESHFLHFKLNINFRKNY